MEQHIKSFKLLACPLLITLLIFNYSCKKYSDGPLISFESKKQRLYGGWDVEYFSINGYDSTAYLKNKPFYGKYYLEKAEQYHDACAGYKSDSAIYEGYCGYWNLKHKNEDLSISLEIYKTGHLGPYRAKENVYWKITRLTKEDLWLKCLYDDGREYFVKFKKVKI